MYNMKKVSNISDLKHNFKIVVPHMFNLMYKYLNKNPRMIDLFSDKQLILGILLIVKKNNHLKFYSKHLIIILTSNTTP